MKIKKYVADSMPEVLKLVKADLGPRAVILNTRTLRKSGTFGLKGKGQVEVTAAVDADKPGIRKKPDTEKAQPASAPKPSRAPAPKAKATPPQGEWAARISEQIGELRSALQSGAYPQPQDGFLPGALGPLAQQMEAAGLNRQLAHRLLKAILLNPGAAGLKELKPLQERAAQMLSRQFQPPVHTQLTPGVRSVVALVGPAGTGKTTAAARIAAHFASQKAARMAFIAADTDRVGGLEQLRAYAGILGIPVDVAYTSEEMGEAISTRRDVDLILIDTAGIGPLASDQIEALGDLLREAGPNELHLVLDATTDFQQMRDTVKAYAGIGTDRLLVTKLDETARLGAICSLAVESRLPLSFTTDGRSVPGNLHPADPKALSRTLFLRRPHGKAD